MDNYVIAEDFSLLAKLMDIHGDNSFKAKSYASAAFTIDRLPTPLTSIPVDKIFSIRGIGDAIGKKIVELLETGKLTILNEYLEKTPPGILDMMAIKGIGPKKIATIWKELEIESLGELLYACNENRLTLYKGFGEKTQKNIKEAIEFFLGSQGSYLYQQMESFKITVEEKLRSLFPDVVFEITGEFRRQMEIINKLEWVTTISKKSLIDFFLANSFEIVSEEDTYVSFKGKENVTLGFYCSDQEHLYATLFQTSCSESFFATWKDEIGWDPSKTLGSEMELFESASLPLIPVFRREDPAILVVAKQGKLKEVIVPADIRGIIHSHSNWSDGVHTLEQMALTAKEQGLEYLVISDHSKTAFYANGLSEERIYAQHKQVDELNKKLAPFRIFKSIESDILNDGSLDYDDEVLAGFDLVIASIHSNLKMPEEKAMMRLMNAIENPYTSILGHMTGRLILSRNGYPVNHEAIIEACAENNVVIELNAHPRRLDIDWRWIEYAVKKGVLISINPDAHAVEGFEDCRYGVLVAQKAGLTKENNLSSFSLDDFERFLIEQHAKRG